MRVLVTGSTGYIGTVLVPMLLAEGHDVAGLDTDYYSRCTFTGAVSDIPTSRIDVRDVSAANVKDFDAIIHLAGLSNDPLGDYKPNLTEDINFSASVRLAQMAKEAGVGRFLFASSCSNYGASGDKFLTEDAAFNPVTPYGQSKVRVEEQLNKLADGSFSPVYLRASTAYGLSPRIRFDLVVNNLTAWAYTTGRVYLKSDGTPWRPIVHVEDICRAYIAALQAPRELVHNQAFNVGTTTENYQIRELADMVQEIVPGCTVEYANDAGPDKRCYRVDCNRIARVLHGFKPQWTARRGVEQLYQAYKTIGLKLEDFEGPKFMRIAHVKKLISDGLLDQDLRWCT
ncbi:MAG: NAD(P)-dependent oxidoreductase [Sterolibacteriaceae bacterium]|nr:NAD(P)-dependent oxidoreductase [Sterolibacteriaceae bacterium]MBK9085353.1 NAD(P)-dependent oxidoreductase [Sterolibacteriaceae bacterium]